MKYAQICTLLLALGQVRMPFLVTDASNLLSASDITFDTFIRVPATIGDMAYPAGALMAGRNVGGVPHLFGWQMIGQGHAQYLYEFNVDPAVLGGTSTSIDTAPRATLYANWGDPGHGNKDNWDGSCVSTGNGYQHFYNTGMYYNPVNNIFYFTYNPDYAGAYIYQTMAATLDSVSGTTGTTSYVGGPWRLEETSQYNAQVRHGFRSTWFQVSPIDGTMLTGGGGYEDPTKSWGPNLYGGRAFPTGSDPSGCSGSPSAAIASTYELVDYYHPVGPGATSPGSYNGWTGALTGTAGSFTWPVADFGLTYAFQRSGVGAAYQPNPLVGGIGAIDDSNGTSFVGWFDGAHKKGVIFSMSVSAGQSSDPTDCSNTAMAQYLNGGVSAIMHFSSHSGTPSGTITGGTSGAVFDNSLRTDILATDNVLQSAAADNTFPDLVIGETFTGPGPFTGVLDGWKRGNRFDGAGGTGGLGNFGGCTCVPGNGDLCATGPSYKFLTPILAIYDPSDLTNVKNNTATDYETTPHAFFALNASPFSLTLTHPRLPLNAGGWVDSVHNKFYIMFHEQDDVTLPGGSTDVYARYSINDSAAPSPTLLEWLWERTPALSRKRSVHPRPLQDLLATLQGWLSLPPTHKV